MNDAKVIGWLLAAIAIPGNAMFLAGTFFIVQHTVVGASPLYDTSGFTLLGMIWGLTFSFFSFLILSEVYDD